MEIGLLPALGGGLAELRRSGQLSRFLDGYLGPYARAFERVWYASYLPETLAEHTREPALLEAVRLLAPPRRRARLLRAFAIPLVHRRELSRCAVLRVFQVTGVIPALVARACRGTPFVTTYGFWYARLSRPGPARPAKRVLERVGLRLAAAVIVPTAELAAHAATMAAADRVHVIPNGVDVERFAPPAERADHGGRILYVGRLSPEKNLSALVRAAAGLRPRRPATLVLIGAGPLRGPLEAEARAAGLPVEFPGVVDHAELPRWLAGADAFVLPSFTEGHPKALIEAMASGLPCIASDCPGNRSLIRDGETGLLFDPSSAAALARALERALGDPALGRALGRRARTLVCEEYDLRRLVAAEIDLLKRAARTPGG